MAYQAPVDDIMLALKVAGDLDASITNGLYRLLDEDTIAAVIGEAGAFATGVLDPLNWSADREGSKLAHGVVTTPAGFQQAYRAFADGGWSALPADERYGGQGLPEIVSSAVCEIWNAANMAFGMCPLLTQGAIHAIAAGGSDALKATYLPNMVSGRWTGTMNLTEPHAGSDLSELRTRADRMDDGTYRISGTKIYISYGEHDLTENIIHLVLARLPDAPEGTRGISLFLVPKVLVSADGALGARNDVVCTGIEHKLGIIASPTCTMKFGESGGAVGYLVGEENRGLANMFVMMNAARLAVGMQGVAIAERALQRATAFAQERRQGRAVHATTGGMSLIIEHPDVRRMLLGMAASTQAARMIGFATAAALDMAHLSVDAVVRKSASMRAALLTPLAKAYGTDTAVEVASLGVQVHGGMGFVEETGAAQHLRDARILPIYEGTNGIQAIDLVMRKISLDGGAVLSSYMLELADNAAVVRNANRAQLSGVAEKLSAAIRALQMASEWLLRSLQTSPDAALAGATPYLRLFSITVGASYLAKAALVEADTSKATVLARFYADNILVLAEGLAQSVTGGADAILVAPTSEVFG